MRTKDQILQDTFTQPDSRLLLEVLVDIRDSLAELCELTARGYTSDARIRALEAIYGKEKP